MPAVAGLIITATKGVIKELEVVKQTELLAKIAEVAAQKGITVEELLNTVIKQK